ncbi:unnamed protein product [Chironomus riparius]|uniref:Uncharacterized protein n=1 Tax=Chironomus riparius TaxID=315576 RepID=A0A9N9WV24_9DIPT|nr:unnamed protein product [Chironomus riparius]
MTCMYERTTRIEKDVGEYEQIRCSVVRKFEVKTRGIEIDSVPGVDLWKFPYPSNFSDVGELHISTHQVLYIPTGISIFFPNLKDLSVINCGLKELKQNDMKSFPDLKFLLLFGNAVEVLEKDLFKFNPKLVIIDMNMNNLKHIDAHVFDHLNGLGSLNFAGNLCITLSMTGPEGVKEVIDEIRKRCQNFGALGGKKKIVIEGKQRGKYFWIFVGCGIITGIFSICAFARIAFGIVKGCGSP